MIHHNISEQAMGMVLKLAEQRILDMCAQLEKTDLNGYHGAIREDMARIHNMLEDTIVASIGAYRTLLDAFVDEYPDQKGRLQRFVLPEDK